MVIFSIFVSRSKLTALAGKSRVKIWIQATSLIRFHPQDLLANPNNPGSRPIRLENRRDVVI